MANPRGFHTYQPEQLLVLQRAFDRACATRKLAPDDDERRQLALRMLNFFAAGAHDEDRLVALAAQAAQDENSPTHAAA